MLPYSFPQSLRELINELSKLPSIGQKSALRLAYSLLERDKEEARRLAAAITNAREKVKHCKECFAFTEEEVCSICSSQQRDRAVICVVEKPADVLALERAGGFHGLYHVLHGLWAPLRGVNPEETKIKELLSRIKVRLEESNADAAPLKELILATSTTVEGDATALYIASAVESLELRVSRIAQGLPQGGELEYADEVTLSHALEGRQSLQ